MNAEDFKVRPIADEFVTLYRSPDPKTVFCYSPGICVLPSGRLLATIDLGGSGVKDLPGIKATRIREGGGAWQGKIFTSDDKGITWTFRANFPFMHARPFVAGNSVYVLGHADDLAVIRSDDSGESWSGTAKLTDGEKWHQAPCNVHHANGSVYLVMERRTSFDIRGWYVGEIAPVLMRGRIGSDLTKRENWTFASEITFNDIFQDCATEKFPDHFGIPFYDIPFPHCVPVDGSQRYCAPSGWLETNVVQFTDPDHYWSDTEGKTFHLWMRAHTGRTGFACMLKVVEKGKIPGTGEMVTAFETVSSGKKILYVPCPGGQMKFHILYDQKSELFWLLSTQATDSMTRADRLSPFRYGLPDNERNRLQLHFSKNMIDWCFAGLVAIGPVEKASRHYASMAIDGEDLVILSRSGDENAKSPHDGNLITFHRVKDFRKLVY